MSQWVEKRDSVPRPDSSTVTVSLTQLCSSRRVVIMATICWACCKHFSSVDRFSHCSLRWTSLAMVWADSRDCSRLSAAEDWEVRERCELAFDARRTLMSGSSVSLPASSAGRCRFEAFQRSRPSLRTISFQLLLKITKRYLDKLECVMLTAVSMLDQCQDNPLFMLNHYLHVRVLYSDMLFSNNDQSLSACWRVILTSVYYLYTVNITDWRIQSLYWRS